MRVILGTLLQILSAFAITASLPKGPLRPQTMELAAALLLAPLGAALFFWATRSIPKNAGRTTLVTTGAYRWLRNPMYLSFLALLIASGLLISIGPKLVLAVALYLAGTELRIASEEADLTQRFPEAFPTYQRQTRWRYFPGLR